LKITPADIKNQKFGKSFRGYDPSEVDAFLEMVSSTLEDQVKENSRLKEKLSSVESTLIGYKDLEGNLKEALVTAQKSAEEIRQNAQKEAQLLMRETQIKAERKMEESYNVLSGLKRQIADLNNLKREYVVRLRSMLETHLKVLESMEKEDQSYKEELQLAGSYGQFKSNSDKKRNL
jgi:cell division initiation protein